MSETDTRAPERVITSVAELRELVGKELGVSDWLEINQERVNQFADATGDHQYIHIDPERAAATFFGGTIAHGFLTLSLSHLLRSLTPVQIDLGGKLIVNYGLNTVRFTAPVPVGKRLRMRTKLAEVEEIGDQAVQIEQVLIFEVEGSDRPACFAEALIRVYF
ncbi:MAG: enoyl-CoA hydratase [Chloroflexi bacterium]|nr:MAG: enoyl-CoA hydratase [Chloroflexota bacterium]